MSKTMTFASGQESGQESDLPCHPQNMTTDFLTQALNAPSGSLQQIDFSPIGTGQVADSYRLQLIWNGFDGPTSLVAKCSAGDKTSRETAHNLHLYEIETSWYAQLASSAGVRVPHPHYVAFDAASGDFVLLLEDCAPAKQIDQMLGVQPEDVAAALAEAAHLHRFRWGDPQLGEIAWLNYGQNNKDYVKNLLPAIAPEFLARYRTRLAPEILDLTRDFVAHYEAYAAAPAKPPPLALTHGDFRLDNMLYRDGAGRVVILDWQTVSASAPMLDVAYCIATSLADPKIRAQMEEKLLADYLAQLNLSAGAYEFETAWHDYRHAAFAGLLMALVSSMVVERTPRGDEMFAVMAERSAWQALHLDSLSLC